MDGAGAGSIVDQDGFLTDLYDCKWYNLIGWGFLV